MTDHRTAWRWAAGGFALGALVLLVVAVTEPDEASGEAMTVTVDPDHDGDPLPVITVDPATDLVDHQVVTVRGEGFNPADSVTLWQCTDRSPCGSDFSEVDDDGTFSRTVGIVAGGDSFDCRSADATCELRVDVYDDAADDYFEAGAAPLRFDPTAPLASPPTLSATPTTGLSDGDLIAITGENFRPGDGLDAIVCDSPNFYQERCQLNSTGIADVVDVDGHLDVPYRATAVMETTLDSSLDCRLEVCYLQISPELVDAEIFRLEFEPDSPLAPPPEAFVRVVDGTDLHLQGEGFLAGEEVSTGVCIRIDDRRTCQAPTPHHPPAAADGAIDSTFTPEPFDGFDGVEDCRAHQCSVFVAGVSLPSRPPLHARFALDP